MNKRKFIKSIFSSAFLLSICGIKVKTYGDRTEEWYENWLKSRCWISAKSEIATKAIAGIMSETGLNVLNHTEMCDYRCNFTSWKDVYEDVHEEILRYDNAINGIFFFYTSEQTDLVYTDEKGDREIAFMAIIEQNPLVSGKNVNNI